MCILYVFPKNSTWVLVTQSLVLIMHYLEKEVLGFKTVARMGLVELFNQSLGKRFIEIKSARKL